MPLSGCLLCTRLGFQPTLPYLLPALKGYLDPLTPCFSPQRIFFGNHKAPFTMNQPPLSISATVYPQVCRLRSRERGTAVRCRQVVVGRAALSFRGARRAPRTWLAASRVLQKGQGQFPGQPAWPPCPRPGPAAPAAALWAGDEHGSHLAPINKLATLLLLPYLAWLTMGVSITHHLWRGSLCPEDRPPRGE